MLLGTTPKPYFQTKEIPQSTSVMTQSVPPSHCKFEWPKDQYSKRRKHVTAGPNKSRERKLSHPLSNLRLTVLFVPEETRSYYNNYFQNIPFVSGPLITVLVIRHAASKNINSTCKDPIIHRRPHIHCAVLINFGVRRRPASLQTLHAWDDNAFPWSSQRRHPLGRRTWTVLYFPEHPPSSPYKDLPADDGRIADQLLGLCRYRRIFKPQVRLRIWALVLF